MEMRKMPGMSGEVDEHPASSNAGRLLAIVFGQTFVVTYKAIL
jgi:hypothetical protein